MSKNHPIVDQLKQFRSYHDDAKAHDVATAEALKLSLLTPAERGAFLHSVYREIEKHPDVTPVQRLQMQRFKNALSHADRKLKDAGR
jgi:DNA-binding transcriptional regulator YbjK